MTTYKKMVAGLLAAVVMVSLAACAGTPDLTAEQIVATVLNAEQKGATAQTAEKNAAVYGQLDFTNTQENEFALRGLIDAPEALELKDDAGNVIWSQKAYDFVDETDKAPDTVNPSLWQNTINNHAYGLFEVIDGCTDVLVVLPPGGLDRCDDPKDWVRAEIAYALKSQKNVIPIMMRGFQFDEEKMPDDIRPLANLNGIEANSHREYILLSTGADPQLLIILFGALYSHKI